MTPNVGSMIDRSGSILLRGENDPVRGANLLDQSTYGGREGGEN